MTTATTTVDRAIVALAVACAVLSGVAVVWLRSVEVEAEFDAYHVAAEHILAGQIAFDRFHPLGYPLLVAGVLWVTGHGLIAGGLVSSLAAGVVVWATGRVAECLRAGAGPIAALLTAANGLVWIYGEMACSDMTAAAAAMAAVALLAAAPAGMSPRRALAIGALLGFGLSVRFAAAVVLVFVGLWLLHRGGMRAAAAAAVGAVLGSLPQTIPSLVLAGGPLTNDNWHNVYLKVVCGFDYECLQRAYDTGTMPTALEFARDRGGDVLWLGLRDTWIAGSEVLSSMLFGATQMAAGTWFWPLLVAVLGLVLGSTVRRTGITLAAFAGLQVLAVCLVFEPRPRVLMSVLPLLLVGVAVAMRSLPAPAWRRLLVVAWVAASLWHGAASYRRFLGSQAVAEVALACELPRIVQRPMVLLTTLSLASNKIDARVLGYQAPGQPTPAASWEAVRSRMQRSGADVFLTGRVSNAHLFAHLADSPVPADFTVLHRDPDAIALERMPPPTPWVESFTLEPPSPRVGDRVVMTLRLAADVDVGQVAAVGIAVRDAAGTQSLFDLPPDAAGVFTRTFDLPPPAGDWQLTPFVLGVDGNARRAAEVPMVVQP